MRASPQHRWCPSGALERVRIGGAFLKGDFSPGNFSVVCGLCGFTTTRLLCNPLHLSRSEYTEVLNLWLEVICQFWKIVGHYVFHDSSFSVSASLGLCAFHAHPARPLPLPVLRRLAVSVRGDGLLIQLRSLAFSLALPDLVSNLCSEFSVDLSFFILNF